MRRLLEVPQGADRLRLQVILPPDCRPADLIVLDVLPYPLIRIQVGRVRRKKEKLKRPPGRLNEIFHLVGLVDGTSVDNQKNFARRVLYKLLAELNEVLRPETAFVNMKP